MKIMIMGHAGHGKDTVCEMLGCHGYTWASSSAFMCENVVYPTLKEKYNYESPEQCHADRHDHRKEWYQLIADFNTPDKTALAKAIYANHDVYCGIRHIEEFNSIKAAGLFDCAIWVDASDRLPAEDERSCSVTKEMADFVIDNNGTIAELEKSIKASIRRLEYEESKTRLNNKVTFYPSITSGPGFTILWNTGNSKNGAAPEDLIDSIIHKLSGDQEINLPAQQKDDVVDYLRAASLTIKSSLAAGSLRAVG